MRTLPHSVVVITSSKIHYKAHPKGVPNPAIKPTKPRDYRGITLSSFMTITLEPEPIICFNIKYPSETYAAIAQSKHFLVHVLEASENGMLIADAFTKGSKHAKDFIRGGRTGLEVTKVEVMTRFKGERMSLPMLRAKSVMRVLRCSVLPKTLMVADHMVVFARVEEIWESEEGGLEGKTGLCYADGRYRGVGELKEDIVEEEEEKKKVKEYVRPTLAHFIQSPPDHPLSVDND
jgi:flavin reductase (DIM6/NTAB) family NADH-FMN oxidoreductase RutF